MTVCSKVCYKHSQSTHQKPVPILTRTSHEYPIAPTRRDPPSHVVELSSRLRLIVALVCIMCVLLVGAGVLGDVYMDVCYRN